MVKDPNKQFPACTHKGGDFDTVVRGQGNRIESARANITVKSFTENFETMDNNGGSTVLSRQERAVKLY